VKVKILFLALLCVNILFKNSVRPESVSFCFSDTSVGDIIVCEFINVIYGEMNGSVELSVSAGSSGFLPFYQTLLTNELAFPRFLHESCLRFSLLSFVIVGIRYSLFLFKKRNWRRIRYSILTRGNRILQIE